MACLWLMTHAIVPHCDVLRTLPVLFNVTADGTYNYLSAAGDKTTRP